MDGASKFNVLDLLYVGRLSREQVADYARRKGVPLHQAERWLASNLDYDPE